MSFHLSLEETAKQTDTGFEQGGVSFLADERGLRYLDGLVIDVQSYYGRESVIAFHPTLGGGC